MSYLIACTVLIFLILKIILTHHRPAIRAESKIIKLSARVAGL